jgi:hypothetical protein
MSQLRRSAPALDQVVDECAPEIREVGTPDYVISTLRNWASVVAVWNAALRRRQFEYRTVSAGAFQKGGLHRASRALV